MAVQVTTQGSLTAEMKTYYDRQLLARALPVLIHSQFGQTRPIPAGSGKTIEFRRFSALGVSTAPITEGTTPAGNSLTASAVTASVNQYGDYIQGSDLLDLTAIDPIMDQTAQLLGEQAGYSIDTIVRDILVAGTTVQYANGKASRILTAATDVMTVTEIRKAVRTLQKNKARPHADGSYVAIVSPSVAYDLQTDTNWVNAQQYAGSQRIFTGEIGQLYGVRFVMSTEAKVFTGAGASGADIHATLVLGADAYGIVPLEGHNLQTIFKPLGSSGAADPLDQRWSQGWKAMFTAAILNDAFMVRIESGVSG